MPVTRIGLKIYESFYAYDTAYFVILNHFHLCHMWEESCNVFWDFC